MKLSRTATYAVHVMAYLAHNTTTRPVPGYEAAEALGLPVGFLLRILVALSRARLLIATKGPMGGYQLARPAKKITVLDVMEAVEGPFHASVGWEGNDSALSRTLSGVVGPIAESVRQILAAVTIASLAVPSSRPKNHERPTVSHRS